MLGKRPVPGRPTNLDYNSKAGPIALAVGAVVFFFRHFFSHLSFLYFY